MRKLFMEWMWFTVTNISAFGFQTETLTFWGNSTFGERTCYSRIFEKAPTVQGQMKVFEPWDPQGANSPENSGLSPVIRRFFYLLTMISIHLLMHQPEIMKMTFVLVVSYLETTDFFGTLCLMIQAWTACSCSLLSSSSQKVWPSKWQHVLC